MGTGPDGVVPSWMVSVSASVNLPLHHKVQKFSSVTGSPGGPGKRAIKRLWWCGGLSYHGTGNSMCGNPARAGMHSFCGCLLGLVLTKKVGINSILLSYNFFTCMN